MTREGRQHQEKVQAAKSSRELQKLEESHHWNMRGWEDWLNSIVDPKLVARAKRMGLSLDDIPKPACDDADQTPGHWRETEPGSYVLHGETRRALQKAIRERAPAYHKERRENYEFYLKIVLPAITGIGGTIIGIILGCKKWTP
jgi:hypothetical protein